jgi:hypothetical protein
LTADSKPLPIQLIKQLISNTTMGEGANAKTLREFFNRACRAPNLEIVRDAFDLQVTFDGTASHKNLIKNHITKSGFLIKEKKD